MDCYCTLVLFLTILSYGATISTEHPDMSDIYRPCCFTDIQCIREEFLKRNWFVDTTHLPSDPSGDLVIPEIKIEESYFNLTIILENGKFRNLANAEVLEFYINEKTDRAVLSLGFSNFTVDSKGLFVYHRIAKEPVITNTHITAFYPTMLTTTVIKGLSPCTKHEYETHARITDHLPKYDLGCGLDKIQDPEIKCLFKTFEKRITVAIQGSSLKLSPIFATFYMGALTKPRPTCDNHLYEDVTNNC